MKRQKIAIIGSRGHVGTAMASMFWGNQDYQTIPYDLGLGTKETVNNCDLAIICVPTPQAKDGSCDTSIVEEVVAWIETPLILVKSTIPPGTTEYLKKKYKKRIVMSPEYVGESKYYTPEAWKNPLAWPFQIFGGDKKDTAEITEIFKPILNQGTFFMQTDSTTAEVIKYAENVWGAMKVTWANEFYEICKTFGVNYDEMREGWALDPRVEKQHTLVYKRNRGFGGKCYVKDLSGMIKSSEKAGYIPEFLKEVQKSNERFRRMNK